LFVNKIISELRHIYYKMEIIKVLESNNWLTSNVVRHLKTKLKQLVENMIHIVKLLKRGFRISQFIGDVPLMVHCR
jgi:hypothetical protein